MTRRRAIRRAVARGEARREVAGAIHESAHAVAAHVLGYVVVEAGIVPNEEPGEGGHVTIEFDARPSRELDRMIVWMMGFHASRGKDPMAPLESAHSDLQKAAQAAERLGRAPRQTLAAWQRAETLVYAFLRIEQHWAAILALAAVLLKKRKVRYPAIEDLIDRHLAVVREKGRRPTTEHERRWARYMRTRNGPSGSA